jgi:tetratricopeptide (TPR) repeat protein
MWRSIAAVLLVFVLGACAARLPIVVDPAYTTFLFPSVPERYEGTRLASSHEEAWTYLQLGDLSTSEDRYTVLLTQSPEFYPAITGLGWVNLGQEDYREADEYFARAIEIAPTYVSGLVGRGQALLGLNRLQEAITSFEAALAVEPSLSGVAREIEGLRFTVVTEQLGVARAAAADGDFDAARIAYEQVIAASPESAFLHLELARVERNQGNLIKALRHAEDSVQLNSLDVEAFLFLGEIHELNANLESALRIYERASEIEPNDVLAQNVDRVRELIFMSGLPSQFGEISAKANVTRGDLAVLIGVRFADFILQTGVQSIIITDTRQHWGSEWIQTVVAAGIMDVDAAYRFDPSRLVRRGELAEVLVDILDLLEVDSLGLSVSASVAPPKFSDMSTVHLNYPSARRAVEAGLLTLVEDDSFQPSRSVTGLEVVEVVGRLSDLMVKSR